MHIEDFADFDAFVESVRDVDCRMMLQNPARRSWTIHSAEIAGLRVQMGQLGSGNIVKGQCGSGGAMICLPLSDTRAYTLNGQDFGRASFMTLDPRAEFTLSTKLEHDWCAITIPIHVLDRDADFEDSRRPMVVLPVNSTWLRRTRTERACSPSRVAQSQSTSAEIAPVQGLNPSVPTRCVRRLYRCWSVRGSAIRLWMP